MLVSERAEFLFKTKTFLLNHSGPSCLKQTTTLLNLSLKFQTFISRICQYFLTKKIECKSFSHFFNKKNQCIKVGYKVVNT